LSILAGSPNTDVSALYFSAIAGRYFAANSLRKAYVGARNDDKSVPSCLTCNSFLDWVARRDAAGDRSERKPELIRRIPWKIVTHMNAVECLPLPLRIPVPLRSRHEPSYASQRRRRDVDKKVLGKPDW